MVFDSRLLLFYDLETLDKFVGFLESVRIAGLYSEFTGCYSEVGANRFYDVFRLFVRLIVGYELRRSWSSRF